MKPVIVSHLDYRRFLNGVGGMYAKYGRTCSIPMETNRSHPHKTTWNLFLHFECKGETFFSNKTLQKNIDSCAERDTNIISNPFPAVHHFKFFAGKNP